MVVVNAFRKILVLFRLLIVVLICNLRSDLVMCYFLDLVSCSECDDIFE
jgi:hypothetical protein